jgi:diguanylate cyclase (GGDEF)-like protein/PAS domain S-box-containing protein
MNDKDKKIKQLELENERLKFQLDSLTSTIDEIEVYVFSKDLNGKYTYVNEAVARLFGKPKNDIIGCDDSHFFALQESNDIRTHDQIVLKEGKTVREEERNIVSATGEEKYYMTVKSPLKDSKGEIQGLLGVSTDITSRKAIEKELHQNREMLSSIFDNIDACVYLKNNQYQFEYINPQTEVVFGQTLSEIVGRKGSDFLPAEISELFHATDRQVIEEKETVRVEEVVPLEDGSTKSYWSIKVPLLNDHGEVDKMIGFSTDITEITELRAELEKRVEEEYCQRKKQEVLAQTDALTGIFNRLKIDIELANALTYANSYGTELSIILIDIDHFKQVNDQFGHQKGDEILRSITECVTDKIRSFDKFGRWGGEEFLIICPRTDLNGALILAEKLRASIESTIQQTASFGVTAFQTNDTLDAMLYRADKALYKAKNNGRNLVISQQ